MRIDPCPLWSPMTKSMSPKWVARRVWHPFRWRKFKHALDRITCVLIDLETTGVNPKKHSAIKIGAISIYHGKIIDSMEYGIKPWEGFQVTQEALAVNGWTGPARDDLDQDTAFAMIKNMFHDHPSSRGKIRVAGHNVAFDIGFLKEMAEKADEVWDSHDTDTRVHWRAIDTAHISMVPYWYGELKSTGLDGMCKSLGLWHDLRREDMGHQSPLHDCMATLAVLYELMWRYS